MSAEGRTVLVAGAGGTAGRAVCAALAAGGAHVVALGSRAASLTGVAAAESHAIDLADPDAVAALAADIRARRGGVDGLVHLVGGWRGGAGEADWEWLERRVLTTLRVTSRELRDDLSASSAGRLVAVSSASVAEPRWGMANYVTLKAAVETWMAALATGWRVKGTPTAAITFVVRSLDGDGEVVDALAESIAALWELPHAQLNGALVSLGDGRVVEE
ncbi:SDR family NAD(P)-dependent oxidoreductase [Microcella daejeonensis]|uniref:SDR family NAD(P)-dependent oxidoreductase n=1 Tax=Microcella daejeonensis TaxID=2994971 RepID=UPI00226FD836|nr:SDR family NAD(P)-dependent oxidoreductase [Microcella daejeonensis]WAB84404.1 SDR family NAD(P)-dependent oxidoreductase [Microcella daejeonensis]